jgi:hypothetical protein
MAMVAHTNATEATIEMPIRTRIQTSLRIAKWAVHNARVGKYGSPVTLVHMRDVVLADTVC